MMCLTTTSGIPGRQFPRPRHRSHQDGLVNPRPQLIRAKTRPLFWPRSLGSDRTYAAGHQPTVAAIVIGGMCVLYLVSLAIAIPLGLFSEPPITSSPADPTVMKQGQVVVTPGTKVDLDEEGTSFASREDHASLVGTESGISFQDGTSYVALAQDTAEGYEACSALDYPGDAGKPIAWGRLTIGSMLCVRTTYVETTTSLITVVERSGRSATLKIITWND